MGCDDTKEFTVKAIDERALAFAQPNRVIGQRLEDGLDVERRVTDHLQQVARCSLLFERHS